MYFRLFPPLFESSNTDELIDIDNLYKHRIDINHIEYPFIIKKEQIFYIDQDLTVEGEIVNNGHLIIKDKGIVLNGGLIKNNGKITFISPIKKISYFKKFIAIKETSNHSNDTGFFIDEDILNISNLKIIVSGPENSSISWIANFNIELGKRFETPCYFSNDGGITAKKILEKGDQLYWNSKFTGFEISENWILKILYEF
jgi:hypothetical protein